MSRAGERYAEMWLRHRRVTQKLANLMKVRDGDFVPWEGARTFTELVAHIAAAGEWYLAAARPRRDQAPAQAPVDLGAARAYLARMTAQHEQEIAALRTADLNRVVDAGPSFGNLRVPVHLLLQLMREHEAHHKGQMFVYVRMKGITPPDYMD